MSIMPAETISVELVVHYLVFTCDSIVVLVKDQLQIAKISFTLGSILVNGILRLSVYVYN